MIQHNNMADNTTKNDDLSLKNSLIRYARNLTFTTMRHDRWLTTDTKNALSDTIEAAECGHSGEIYLVIEDRLPLLPLPLALRQTCQTRAVAVFAEQHVWDTADNTGVLIYINLCEQTLHIIADRGIYTKADRSIWAPLCQNALTLFKDNRHAEGLTALIVQIGKVLRAHYPSDDVAGNELANTPVYLH